MISNERRGYSGTISNECYLDYLGDIVGLDPITTPYFRLLRRLYDHEFTWVHGLNDVNRASDGYQLRTNFIYDFEAGTYVKFNSFISVLEVLIAFSKRIDRDYGYPADGDGSVGWFWQMLDNLGLLMYSDLDWDESISEIEIYTVVQDWLERKFTRSGVGSIFPLENPPKDQRRVEMWAQMDYYWQENYG